jgi:hypothetical protein
MVPPAHVRRVAPVTDEAEAALRLFQSMYGCTLHPAGLLHAVAAILDAEAEGRFTLSRIARVVERRAALGQVTAAPAEAWRYDVMMALCQRLASSA